MHYLSTDRLFQGPVAGSKGASLHERCRHKIGPLLGAAVVGAILLVPGSGWSQNGPGQGPDTGDCVLGEQSSCKYEGASCNMGKGKCMTLPNDTGGVYCDCVSNGTGERCKGPLAPATSFKQSSDVKEQVTHLPLKASLDDALVGAFLMSRPSTWGDRPTKQSRVDEEASPPGN
jgi:hypothetical protein